MTGLRYLVPLAALAIVPFATLSNAQDPQEIRFENHKFTPQTLDVPSGQKLTLKVTNESQETIEFESFKLNREKVVTPGETISVNLPALSPGSYDFYDDFHQDVPQGAIIAK